MNKKFKYKHENGFVSHWYNKILQVFDGVEFYIKKELSDGFVEVIPTGCDYPILRFPKQTLQEIKEPITFEEWLLHNYPGYSSPSGSHYAIAKDCHEWTVENERMKHEPKKDIDHILMILKDHYNFDIAKKSVELICRLWDKNRGYDNKPDHE